MTDRVPHPRTRAHGGTSPHPTDPGRRATPGSRVAIASGGIALGVVVHLVLAYASRVAAEPPFDANLVVLARSVALAVEVAVVGTVVAVAARRPAVGLVTGITMLAFLAPGVPAVGVLRPMGFAWDDLGAALAWGAYSTTNRITAVAVIAAAAACATRRPGSAVPRAPAGDDRA